MTPKTTRAVLLSVPRMTNLPLSPPSIIPILTNNPIIFPPNPCIAPPLHLAAYDLERRFQFFTWNRLKQCMAKRVSLPAGSTVKKSVGLDRWLARDFVFYFRNRERASEIFDLQGVEHIKKSIAIKVIFVALYGKFFFPYLMLYGLAVMLYAIHNPCASFPGKDKEPPCGGSCREFRARFFRLIQASSIFWKSLTDSIIGAMHSSLRDW